MGVVRVRTDKYPPASQVDEHQAEGHPLAKRRPNRFAEEITRHQRVHVRADERSPSGGHTLGRLAAWVGQQPFAGEQPLDAAFAGRQPQLPRLPNDPPNTPSDIFLSHAENQFPYGYGGLPQGTGLVQSRGVKTISLLSVV